MSNPIESRYHISAKAYDEAMVALAQMRQERDEARAAFHDLLEAMSRTGFHAETTAAYSRARATMAEWARPDAETGR